MGMGFPHSVSVKMGEVCCAALQTFHRNVCKESLPHRSNRGKRSCPLPPIQAVAWISPFLRAKRMAQGISPSADGDQGRCPWTLPAFFCKKLLDRKKFLLMKNKCRCREEPNVYYGQIRKDVLYYIQQSIFSERSRLYYVP